MLKTFKNSTGEPASGTKVRGCWLKPLRKHSPLPDPAYAAEILERNILAFFYQGEITQVLRWLELLPEPLLLKHPLLCAVYAASIALQPPYPPKSLLVAEKWMRTAEDALSNGFQSGNLVRAFIYQIRSYWARYRGEPPEIVLQLIAKSLFVPSQGFKCIVGSKPTFHPQCITGQHGIYLLDCG